MSKSGAGDALDASRVVRRRVQGRNLWRIQCAFGPRKTDDVKLEEEAPAVNSPVLAARSGWMQRSPSSCTDTQLKCAVVVGVVETMIVARTTLKGERGEADPAGTALREQSWVYAALQGRRCMDDTHCKYGAAVTVLRGVWLAGMAPWILRYEDGVAGTALRGRRWCPWRGTRPWCKIESPLQFAGTARPHSSPALEQLSHRGRAGGRSGDQAARGVTEGEPGGAGPGDGAGTRRGRAGGRSGDQVGPGRGTERAPGGAGPGDGAGGPAGGATR